jgi:magnesium transporter
MFTKHHPEVGARPGTLAIPPDSPFPRVRMIRYNRDTMAVTDIDDVSALENLEPWDGVTWIDVQGLGDERTLRAIGRAFALHPLALEDAVNVPQRAKTELYETHQLVIARTPVLESDGTLAIPQVCFIIGKTYLLTFQERYFGFFDAVRERLRNGLGPMRGEPADYLAYALIDAMVDRYYPVAQALADGLEELEDYVVENPHPQVLARIHGIRRQLVVLRRIGRPQREAVNAMLRDRTPFVSERVTVFLRDTHDHLAQIVDLIDSSREMASDLSEAYLSNVSHRTNEIMKVLTLMASIFIPLTFIAGIYGMNFEYMPELGEPWAYFAVWGVMISLAFGMTLFFRHRGWIGQAPPPVLDEAAPGTERHAVPHERPR